MAFPTTLDIFQSYSQVWGHAVTVYSATDVLSFCRAKDLASTIHTGSAAWHLYKCGQKKNGMYWRWEQSSSSVPCHYFIVVHVLFLSSKDKHDLGKTLIVRIIHFSRVFSRKKKTQTSLTSCLEYWRGTGGTTFPKEPQPVVWCQSFKFQAPGNPTAV